jgi:hypothetical protein
MMQVSHLENEINALAVKAKEAEDEARQWQAAAREADEKAANALAVLEHAEGERKFLARQTAVMNDAVAVERVRLGQHSRSRCAEHLLCCTVASHETPACFPDFWHELKTVISDSHPFVCSFW